MGISLVYDFKSDFQQRRMTEEYLGNGCQIAHNETCDVEDSDVVRVIRTENLPPMANNLLRSYRYNSAYHLFKDLSISGYDREVVSLASSTNIDINTLAFFAAEWYLKPALRYARNRREFDALTYFKIFSSILTPHIKEGHWVSLDGIDATDLPVLTDLFCSSTTGTLADKCILDILNTISRAAHFDDLSTPETLYDTSTFESVPTAAFLSAYNSQGATSLLQDYLSIWGLGPEASLPPPPADVSVAQRQAWIYAIGVAWLSRATTKGTAPAECVRELDKSVSYFRSVTQHPIPESYFGPPATGHMEYIESNKSRLCQTEKSNVSAR